MGKAIQTTDLMQNCHMKQTLLFNSSHTNTCANLLPKNGCINYYPELIAPIDCYKLFDQLKQNIAWQFDEIQMFGKKIVTQRKVAWVADPNCSYTYSGVKKHPDKQNYQASNTTQNTQYTHKTAYTHYI